MSVVSIALLPGDGIGPEVVAVARETVDAVAPDHGLAVSWHEHLVGGASIDAHGTALTDQVLEACAGSDAVLLGAVGGPRWDTTDPAKPRPEQGLLGLRAGLGLYAGWNAGTAIGVLAGDSLGDPATLGLDAAFPALFLALLAPLLSSREALAAALLGAGIALALTPITPAGIPVIAATAGCLAGLRRPAGRSARTTDEARA